MRTSPFGGGGKIQIREKKYTQKNKKQDGM